jgi:hypothetical protein
MPQIIRGHRKRVSKMSPNLCRVVVIGEKCTRYPIQFELQINHKYKRNLHNILKTLIFCYSLDLECPQRLFSTLALLGSDRHFKWQGLVGGRRWLRAWLWMVVVGSWSLLLFLSFMSQPLDERLALLCAPCYNILPKAENSKTLSQNKHFLFISWFVYIIYYSNGKLTITFD